MNFYVNWYARYDRDKDHRVMPKKYWYTSHDFFKELHKRHNEYMLLVLNAGSLPFMGMFDWEGVLIPAAQFNKIFQTPNIIYPSE